MGSIESYESAKGKRYVVRYRTPERRQGAKRGFQTKRDAELYLASIETSKARGEYIDASAARTTINSLGVEWLANQTHLKPSSLRPLEIAWRLQVQPRWGNVAVGDVRHSDVQAWVTSLTAGRSATTVLRAYGVLAGILDVAVRDRRVPNNVARGARLPRKVARAHRYLSHQQVHDLARSSGKHEALILVLAYTGLRWGEVTALRVRDVDLKRRRIVVSENAVEVGRETIVGTPKSHKRRSVAFPSFLADALTSVVADKQPNDLLFPGRLGEHLKRATRGERTWFKAALASAEIEPMTVHDLRHTAASLAVSAGANVKAVQRMLGHASAAMTLDVYADLFDDDLDAVADALDLAVGRALRDAVVARSARAVKP
ncbi:tyrosine-type recombinase/integrase [Leifsonia sp. NPDC058292]|uniref:tyrosine-type recombinase/integrase n=1 Tax=Leifsonia sp. NPDC058292 TaxID=3346428 RepID=UPI0036DD9ECE